MTNMDNAAAPYGEGLPGIGYAAREGASAASAAAVAAAQSAPVKASPNEIALMKPIRTHGGQTDRLMIRDPNAGDFMALGTLPFKQTVSGDAVSTDLDFRLCGVWLERLTGVDQGILGTMHQVDFMKAVGALITLLSRDGTDPGN